MLGLKRKCWDCRIDLLIFKYTCSTWNEFPMLVMSFEKCSDSIDSHTWNQSGCRHDCNQVARCDMLFAGMCIDTCIFSLNWHKCLSINWCLSGDGTVCNKWFIHGGIFYLLSSARSWYKLHQKVYWYLLYFLVNKNELLWELVYWEILSPFLR